MVEVTRSFGHLSSRSRAPQSCNASRTHAPTTSVSAGRSRGNGSKLVEMDRQRLPPSAERHARPRRPRPPVWFSVSHTANLPGGGGVADSNAAFVESVSHSTVIELASRSDGDSPDVISLRLRGSQGATSRYPRWVCASMVSPMSRNCSIAFQTALRVTPAASARASPECTPPSASAQKISRVSVTAF